MAEWSRREVLVTLGAGATAGCAFLRGGASHPRYTAPAGSVHAGALVIPSRDLPGPGKTLLVRPGKPHPEVLVIHDGDSYRAVTADCTHWGCTVDWNAAKREWHCPCHGSKYTLEGTVVEGPAKKPLVSVPVQVRDGALVLDLRTVREV